MLEIHASCTVCSIVSMAGGIGGRSRAISRHQREVLQLDRRWLMTWMASFVTSLVFVFGLYALYKATGPHPQVTTFIRGLKHEARWLIPGLKLKPNARDQGARLETDARRRA
jgi:hypothetical protein